MFTVQNFITGTYSCKVKQLGVEIFVMMFGRALIHHIGLVGFTNNTMLISH